MWFHRWSSPAGCARGGQASWICFHGGGGGMGFSTQPSTREAETFLCSTGLAGFYAFYSCEVSRKWFKSSPLGYLWLVGGVLSPKVKKRTSPRTFHHGFSLLKKPIGELAPQDKTSENYPTILQRIGASLAWGLMTSTCTSLILYILGIRSLRVRVP